MKSLLILDTSFKSAYCYYKTHPNPDEEHILCKNKQADFSKIIEDVLVELPDFEMDYESIENSLSIIEYCKLGQICLTICQKAPTEYAACFAPSTKIDAAIAELGESHELVEFLRKQFDQILNNLNNFFIEQIDPYTIIDNAEKKLTDYRCHEHVIGIEKDVKAFIECLKKQGKNSDQFKQLCFLLGWEMLLRHNFSQDKKNNRIITLLLAGFYLGTRKFHNVPIAALLGQMKGKVFFRDGEELLDALLLELACMGFLTTIKSRDPVIVVTADDIEKNLDVYIEAAIELRDTLRENSALKYREFEFVPGIMIITPRNMKSCNQNPKVINIEDRIKQVELNITMKKQKQLTSLQVDTSDLVFDRDEANSR